MNGFKEIELSKIRFSQDLMFRDEGEYNDTKKLDSLSKSIQNSGLIQPVVVQEQSSGEFLLIAGHRRVYAKMKQTKKNGNKPNIFAKVVTGDLDHKALLGIMVEENSMRKDFTTEELFNIVLAMDDAGYNAEETGGKTGRSKKTIERMVAVGRDDYFFDLVKKGLLKYTQANALLAEFPEDKLPVLKDTVREWIIHTRSQIELENLRRKESGENAKEPDGEIHKYLKSWLIKNWHTEIKDGQKPEVGGEWRYGLYFDQKKKETKIPGIKISYDKDPLDRLVDIFWKLQREGDRIKAAIDSRKQLQEIESIGSDYGADYEEFIRKNGLDRFGRQTLPAPDADIPEIDEVDDPPEEDHLTDMRDFIEEPEPE